MKPIRNLFIVGALAVNMLGMAAIIHAQDATAVPETPAATQEAAAPYLGVVFEAADGGVRVVEVLADSPASLAGILVDDLITALNETPVTEDNIREFVQSFAVGDVVTVAVTRGEETLSLEATLTPAPAETHMETRRFPNIDIMPARPMLGISIDDTEAGVRVVTVLEGSPAEAAGIAVDDIVTAINGVAVADAEEASDAVSAAADAAETGEFELTVSVTRGEEALELTATLTKSDTPDIPHMPEQFNFGGRGNRGFEFNFGRGMQIVPRDGEEGAFDVVVPFVPADAAAVTPEVEAALAEIGITIAPVEGEDGVFTLTIPAESLGRGGLFPNMREMPDGMAMRFSGPRGRNFRFTIPNLPDTTAPATQGAEGESL